MSEKADANSIRVQKGIEESMKEIGNSAGGAIAEFVGNLLPKNCKPCDNSPTHAQGSDSAVSGTGNEIVRHFEKMQVVTSDEKGMIELKTGDTLVRAGGYEMLSLKPAGIVVVKPDGSFESNQPAKVKQENGATTLDFGNGHTVVIKDGKISEVNSKDASVIMLTKRYFPDFDGGRPPEIRPPREWPYKHEYENQNGSGTNSSNGELNKKIEKNK